MIPNLALTAGQAAWTLWDPTSGRGEEPSERFKARLLYLRLHGVPFSVREEPRPGSGKNLAFRFEHLAELVVALELIKHGVKPGEAALEIDYRRSWLREVFPEAYERRNEVFFGGSTHLPEVRGLFLELTLYEFERQVHGRPPKLLTPPEVLEHLAEMSNRGSSSFILPLSRLLDRCVERALRAPSMRRGRPAGGKPE